MGDFLPNLLEGRDKNSPRFSTEIRVKLVHNREVLGFARVSWCVTVRVASCANQLGTLGSHSDPVTGPASTEAQPPDEYQTYLTIPIHFPIHPLMKLLFLYLLANNGNNGAPSFLGCYSLWTKIAPFFLRCHNLLFCIQWQIPNLYVCICTIIFESKRCHIDDHCQESCHSSYRSNATDILRCS